MINWRKGLFRFWIVSAIFWIIGIGAFSFGEYNKAAKKESKIKLIVSETKNPKKALQQINKEFPESKQYGSIVNNDFIDMGRVDLKKLSDKELLDLEKKLLDLENFIPGILKEICQNAENDKQDGLYNSILIGFIPPIILLTIGSAIFWALRGFRT